MYEQVVNSPRRRWYINVLMVLGIVAIVLFFALLRGVLGTLLVHMEYALLIIDVACIAGLGVITWLLMKQESSYRYSLEADTLTLEVIRGNRVVVREVVPVADIVRISSASVKPGKRFCAGGISLFYKGGELLFAPDDRLLELLAEHMQSPSSKAV